MWTVESIEAVNCVGLSTKPHLVKLNLQAYKRNDTYRLAGPQAVQGGSRSLEKLFQEVPFQNTFICCLNQKQFPSVLPAFEPGECQMASVSAIFPAKDFISGVGIVLVLRSSFASNFAL